jgi:hypothetical protein
MVRKILFFLNFLALFFLAYFFIPVSVLAALNCPFSPATMGDHDTNKSFFITAEIAPGNYDIWIGGAGNCIGGNEASMCQYIAKNIPLDSNGELHFVVPNMGVSGINGNGHAVLSVEVRKAGTTNPSSCNDETLTIYPSVLVTGVCSIALPPESLKPGNITFTINNIVNQGVPGYGPNDPHHIYLNDPVNSYNWELGEHGANCPTGNNLVNPITTDKPLDANNTGDANDVYTLKVDDCPQGGGMVESLQCQTTFKVTPSGGGVVTEPGSTLCQVCPKGTFWLGTNNCVNDITQSTDCCYSGSTKSNASLISCNTGSVCDPLHRSQDQTTANNPTGCVPISIANQGGAIPPAPSPLCSQFSSDGKCESIASGLGINLPTDASGLIKALMGVVLSLVGAIAIILIIISGYRLMVSQGNPENIKNAREQLTAAIVGLLFVIFSLVILQVIGVNILGLPGISP